MIFWTDFVKSLAPRSMIASPRSGFAATWTAATLCALSAATALAAPEVGFRQAVESETPLTMLARGAGVTIQDGNSRRNLRLADGVWMQAIERLGERGWIATGTSDRLTGRSLLLKIKKGSRVRTLTAPSQDRGSIAWWPLPMVHRSELVGLVWFEGDRMDRLAVVGSRWLGDGWAQPEVISPPGVGSQAGLTATVLADGSWMLAWTRWDGEDDEVVWSLGDGKRFSRPAPVHPGNAVADILPSVLADGRGAIIAWSQERSNRYVLQMARFDGRGWRPIDVAASSAVGPQMVRRGGSPWLNVWTNDDSERSAWVLSRLQGDKLLPVDRVDGASPRPAIDATAGGKPRLRAVDTTPGGAR